MDDEKARRNLVKHETSFEAARLVFDDPNVIDERDDDPDEQRFWVTGLSNGRLLTVIYTERGQRIRIISARPATRHEQEDYFGHPVAMSYLKVIKADPEAVVKALGTAE